MTSKLPTIAVLGGTGAEGSGLAFRWARAGYKVIIGSRDASRAGEAAAAIDLAGVTGTDNESAARECDIAVLTVPFAAQRETLAQVRAELQGKILIDVTVPLAPPRVSRVQLPAEGSAAQLAQNTLGDGVEVVSAFQSVSAHHLKDPDYKIDCDVLVCGDGKEAREAAIVLAKAAGMNGIHAGPLANAAASEALTSVLIWINRRYKVPSAGIRITGLDGGETG
ncbi:MAG: NADPH-dependent F420 reductase [Rhodospirillales bacterium]|nr:NADPH-dependent F420 reductase [Rhodospirillales bacterium]